MAQREVPEDKAREMRRGLEEGGRMREDRHPDRGQTFIQLQHFTSWKWGRSGNERGGEDRRPKAKQTQPTIASLEAHLELLSCF